MSTAGYLQDAKNQQKRLAETITSKGITATATEKYKDLVDKVAQIENLKGEERTLENFTNVLSEPKSIVQLEYPIDNMITVPYVGSSAGSSITTVVNSDNSVTFNGTAATGVSTYYYFKSFPTLAAGTYAYSMQDVPGCHYTLGVVKPFDEGTTSGTISVTTDRTDSYFILNIPAGTTLNNVTVRQPVLYKVPESKTLNAKLGSKNLFDTANATKLNGAGSFSVANNVITVSQNTTYKYSSANVLISKSLIGKTVTLLAKSSTSGVNIAGLRIQWVSSSATATGDMILGVPDSAGNIVVTGTVPTQPDEAHSNLCLMIYSNTTGTLETGTTYTATYSDIQIELGTTATPYTPYISDFSTVNVTRCGKNFFDKSTLTASSDISDLTQTTNGFTFKTTATLKTINVGSDVYLPAGTYYCSGTTTCSDTTYKGGWAVYDNENKKFVINKSDKGTINSSFTVTESKTYQLNFYAPYTAPAGVTMTFENVQLEKGSVATTYEPYQGETYTPTASGEVTGITNLYPTTTLLTNNAGVVFEQVTGGTYKEILPSTNKNGITKVYQPSVDSTIDSNITSDNIKQGVSILGVTGDYICNYTYDETTKELVLIL